MQGNGRSRSPNVPSGNGHSKKRAGKKKRRLHPINLKRDKRAERLVKEALAHLPKGRGSKRRRHSLIQAIKKGTPLHEDEFKGYLSPNLVKDIERLQTQ